MTKKIGLKLLSVIAAFSVFLSVMVPLTAVLVSAEAPDVPDNAVVVLDKDGMSNTVGEYYNYLWDRLHKSAPVTDFSEASFIEFDLKFSDYDAVKATVAQTGFPLCFNLTSSGGQWSNRAFSPNIFDYETGSEDGWYHYSIPKSAFTAGDSTVINWSNVNYWMFGFNYSSVTSTGSLSNVSIAVKNICGTVPKGPSLPEGDVVVLDRSGSSNTVGDYYVWLWDRIYNHTATADFSAVDFIEFDIKSDMYDKLKEADAQHALTLSLNTGFSTSNNKWIQRHFVLNVLNYETGTDGEWHHISVPKAAFIGDAGADWASKDFWMLGFWNNAGESTGDLKTAKIQIANICGIKDKPSIPDNVVAVIDEVGLMNTIGNYYVDLYDRLVKTVTPVDISEADYIEFDLKYQDYVALTKKADELGMYLTFNLSSSDNMWNNRERSDNINAYASKGKNGWYHFKIPLADFINVNMGAIDLSAIKIWFIGFDGQNFRNDAGEFKNYTLNVKNICATKASENDIFRPTLTGDAIYVIDQLGVSGKMGEDKDSSYSALSETFKNSDLISGDFTASKKIFMNVYVDDINALPENLSIAFGVRAPSTYRYLNEIEIKDQIVKNGWNEILIPVKNIIPLNADDIENIVVWKLSTNDTSAVGDNADCRLWVCNMAGTVDATAADMPENAAVIIDEAGKENIIGGLYVEVFDRVYKRIEPVDISKVAYIEFDAHFDDFMKLVKRMNELGLTMSFHLTSSNSQWANRFFANNILRYAMEGENGWWHFKIPQKEFVSANVGDIDWEAVNLWMLGIDGTNMYEPTGEFNNSVIKIMNICGTPKDSKELLRPAISGDAVNLIDQMGVLGTFGETAEATYDKISDTFVSDTIVVGDLTLGKYVSVQVYVDDTKALPESLNLAFGVKEGDGYRYLNDIEIVDQIANNGWNEVVIPVAAINAQNAEDLKNIASWRLSSADTSAVGKYADSRLWVCNVIGIVDSTAPELPANVIETINYRGLSGTPGSAFSWLADRMFQEKIGPFDIEVADYIEFDFYVEDYEAVKTAMEDKKMDLIFGISSGDPEKYSTSRYFNRSIAYFFDLVKGDGWNHIKLPMDQLIASGEGGPLDLTAVTSFMLSFMGDEIQGDSSAIANVTFKIINVCATTERPYIKIEKDEDKPSKPEKDVVYINDSEALFDDNGTWNPVAVTVDEDYKTEGKASISNVLFDQTLRTNQLRYIFNETADISDIDTLKFDFFVSDISLLKQRAEMSVVLTSDLRGLSDYYSWKLDLNTLKNGWNSIVIDTDSGYVKDGSPDLTKIKSIIVQCDKADFKSDKYTERVTVKIDNLRYVSKTGSTTLKINTDEELFDEDLEFGDDIWGDEEYTDEEIIPGETVETPTTTAPVETDTRIVKKTVNNVVMQYTWLIIALAVEAVVVAGVVATLYLVKRKKNKSK